MLPNKYSNKGLIIETKDELCLHTIDQAMDLIGLCGSKGTRALLIHGHHLSPDFYNLKTRLAGEIFQKFTNYFIQAALVLDEKHLFGRFGELAGELNRGGPIRVFHDTDLARAWLKKSH